MDNKELYQQKHQAQLDEWHADIAKLRAKASGAKVDAQIAMKKDVAGLERKLENYQAKLSEITAASGDAWDSAKKGVESTWDSMKSALGEFASRFKD